MVREIQVRDRGQRAVGPVTWRIDRRLGPPGVTGDRLESTN